MKTNTILVSTLLLLLSLGLQLRADQTKVPVSLITAEELKSKLVAKQSVTVIDVRNTSSFSESDKRIPGAIHVKLRRLRSRLRFPPLKDVPKNQEVVTYCSCPNEETSLRAAEVLQEAGFTRVRALKAGWRGWIDAGGPVERRKK
jgi:rhodanese-related sulfurtransferase